MSEELIVTLVDGSKALDLVIPLASQTTDDFYAVAEERFGHFGTRSLWIERTGEALPRACPLDEIDILVGDRLVVGKLQRSMRDDRAGVRAVVETGEQKGQHFDLIAGRNEVGRRSSGSTAQVVLSDPLVSRSHAVVEVDSQSVVLSDAGSQNGTDVNGRPISDPTHLQSGDKVQFGDTVLRIEIRQAPGRHLTRSVGRLSFNREPRTLQPDPAISLDLPRPPSTVEKRRFPLPAAVVPVVMGVAMATVLNNPFFLLMAGMGPLMVIWTTLDDRRSGRKGFAEDSRKFMADLDAADRTLAAATVERQAFLEHQHPGTGSLELRARDHDPRLWRRRIRDEDFASVRIGTGSLQSGMRVRASEEGDETLVAEGLAVAERFSVARDVPVAVSLVKYPVMGIVQRQESVGELAYSIVAQLVADQTPKELALAVLAPHHSSEWGFAKWLPHVQSLGDDFRLVADGDEQAQAIFSALTGLVDSRYAAADESIGGGRGQFSPHLVVLIHPPAKLQRRDVADFLARASGAGVSVVWLSDDRTTLPGECSVVVDETGPSTTVTYTDTGTTLVCDVEESATAAAMDTLSRSLAPLDDVSSGSDNQIPSRIDLLDLMGMPDISDKDVVASWARSEKGLRAIVGADADGAVSFDWRKDGPHALVAGTTGAGKSELLQSLVGSMAVLYSPDRLTFVLIDYKGGSAFRECARLPHTVGMVTNLDDHLAERALVSLRAELRHRETLLADVEAKDIADMWEKSPHTAPPNLLLIIDEFAALKSEVPAFVDGLVDIAQRGRSLGVHLLLATQQPSGVIDPKIQGNTNIRVALRVADSSDSVDVIGKPDAHHISRKAPGRGFIRTGPTDISEFQSAYVGGTQADAGDVAAMTFHFGIEDRKKLIEALDKSADAEIDLERLVNAATRAAESTQLPAARKPWIDPLGEVIRHDQTAGSSASASLCAVVGMADYPDQQTQLPYVIDFDEHANVVVFGSSGAGKTTLLRTIAAELALRNSPDGLWLYVLDYASRGLQPLEELPHCGGVVVSDDLDRTRRLLAILTSMADERRQLLGEANASTAGEYQSVTGNPMPRIVVLIDGFGQLWEALDNVDRSEHLVTLSTLISEGRSVGIHFVLSADRRHAVPMSVSSSISGRFVMRMADRDEYSSLGLNQLTNSSPPVSGRAFDTNGIEIQVSVLSMEDSVGAAPQSRTITAIARDLPAARLPAPRPELLPDTVPSSEMGSADGLRVPLGVDETTLSTTFVDLDDVPTFMVFGPDRSGRSNALAQLATALAPSVESAYLFAGRRSPLTELDVWSKTATGAEAAVPIADLLRTTFDQRSATDEAKAPILVVIDDADAFTEGSVSNVLETLVKRGRDANIVVIASMTTFEGHKSYATWVRAIRTNRHGLILQPDLEDDGELFGLRLPRRSGLVLPPGRGMLITRGSTELVQVAVV